MGCGYSKINISSRRGRLKERIQADPDSEENDYSCDFSPGKVRKSNAKGCNSDLLKRNGVSNSFNNEESLASRRRIANKIKPISGPMRPPLNRSASQVDFFRMLDEKIANGKDFTDDDDFDYSEMQLESNCIHRPVPAPCPLAPAPQEDKITLCSPEVTRRSRSRSPSPNVSKPDSNGTNHKAADHELTEMIPIGGSPSPKKLLMHVSSVSIPSSRSSSSNSRSADSKIHQVEAECHVNASLFNSNEDMQMNLNNSEMSKDYPAPDPLDKVIPTSPPQLSNGQVHS